MAPNSDRSTTTQGAGNARSQPRVDVIIVTDNDDLLIELGPVFDDQHRSRPLERVSELGATLKGRRSVVVLDAGSAVDVRLAYAELNARHADVPVIVIATDATRASWEPAMQRGALTALLSRGAALRNEFTTALRTAASRAAQSAGVSVALEQPFSLGSSPARAATPERRKPPVAALAGLLALVAVLAAAGIWWWQQNDAAQSGLAGASPASVAAPPAVAAGGGKPGAATSDNGAAVPGAASGAAAAAPLLSVSQLLSAARVSFADQHFLEPAGSSALDYFTRVLQQEPGNEEARDGVVRLFGIIRSRAELALKSGHLDEAENLLSAVRAASPDSDLAKDLAREVAAEKPRWLAAQARASMSAGSLADAQKHVADLEAMNGDKRVVQDLQQQLQARQREGALDSAAGSIHAMIASGSLLDPPGANAQSTLLAQPAADRKSAPLQAVQRELQSALVARGKEAVRDSRFDAAERYLGAASELGSGSEVTDARQQLATARADAERVATSRASAPAQASAAVPDAAANTGSGYAKTKVRLGAQAEYPEAAKRAHVEGFVDVQFNVSTAGRALNVAVLQSSPPGTFDAAALASVRKTQFEPMPADANGDPPLGRLRVTFKLQPVK